MKTIFLYIYITFTGMIVYGCALSKKGNAVSVNAGNHSTSDTFLTQLLTQHQQYFDTLLKQNDTWQIQIVYTRIDRNRRNKPRFTHYYFNTDRQYYFYPASTVKLPVAALALQRLHELKVPHLNKFSTMITEKESSAQTAVYNDPTAEDGRPNVAHYIKKIFLVSDNDAFNRLYEFLGQEYINNTLQKMGWDSVQILHRLNMTHLSEEENRRANPVAFYDTDAKLLYRKPALRSNLVYQPRSNRLGKGYYNSDSLIHEPFDFSKKNRLPLPDLHDMLLRLIFPKALPKKQRFRLKKGDYKLLYKDMSMLPRESRFPQYDSTYNDAYVKFVFYGRHDSVEPNILIYNKEGDAYGFLTDAAYIINTKNGVEFLLSATINCNSNTGIYNYDKNDYDAVGFPFLKNLGRTIYQYELSRPRKHKPNFKAVLE